MDCTLLIVGLVAWLLGELWGRFRNEMEHIEADKKEARPKPW